MTVVRVEQTSRKRAGTRDKVWQSASTVAVTAADARWEIDCLRTTIGHSSVWYDITSVVNATSALSVTDRDPVGDRQGPCRQPTGSLSASFQKIARLVHQLGSGHHLVGRFRSGVRCHFSRKCPPCGSFRVMTAPRGWQGRCSAGRQADVVFTHTLILHIYHYYHYYRCQGGGYAIKSVCLSFLGTNLIHGIKCAISR